MVSIKRASGRWVAGDQFFDRFHEVEELAERVRTECHTSVVAPRRMGKTSLVRETLRRLEENCECTTFFVDVEGAEDPPDAIAAIAAECRSANGGWSRNSGAVRRKVGQFDAVPYKDFKIRLRAAIHSGNWKEHGDAVFQALAEHEKPCVLAIDELPLFVRRLLTSDTGEITEEGRATADVFLSWLRRNGQIHRQGVTVIVTGSVSLEPILQQAGLTARMNIFQPLELEPWNEGVAIECLAALARDHSIDLPLAVRRRMCDRLRQCVPHHVQQFFDCMLSHLQQSHRETATLEDVQTVYDRDMLGLRGQAVLPLYESRLKLALSDSDYQVAMELLTEAAVNGGVIRNEDLILYKQYYAEQNKHNPFAIEDLMNLLRHDGYLSQTADGYEYLSGLLEDWWRLRYGRTFVPIAKRAP